MSRVRKGPGIGLGIEDRPVKAFKTEPSPGRLELEQLIGVRKCVHLQLRADTHVELRRIMIERGLTMQSIFEEFAQRVIVGDDYTENLLDIVTEQRHTAAMRSMSRVDTDALLSAIGAEPAVVESSHDEES